MNFKESKAIYLQIADRICDEVLLGQYQEEERIPSVREYAAVVEVNANTVMRSYDYLQTQGVIYNKRGIGYFVSVGARKLILSLRKEYFLKEEVDYFFKQIFTLGISAEELSGMLVTGVAMVCGLMFYVVDRNVTQKDNFMEIGGERKTVQLPSCRVLKLTQPPVVWKQKKEGIVEAERMFSFGEVPLEVTAGDSLQQGSFSYAGDMEAFMSMTSVGDTLFVTFDFPEDKLEQHLQNDIWIRVRSEGMELRLPAEVQAVVVDVEDMEANFYGLRCDTLSFRTRYLARLEDCHVTALAAQAQSLHFNSGTVRNLYLNLDEIADWDVNTGSFHIDTEHLSGSRYHRCLLQKNECRRVFWTPLKDDASLSVELKQAVKIEVGE